MAEKEKETPESTAAQAPQDAARALNGAQAQPGATNAKELPEHGLAGTHGTASKGEKLFSWGVYSGINYWVNLASSIAIADYFCNLGGKKAIEGGANRIAKMMSGGDKLRHAKVFGQAQTALRTLTLLSGGWLLVIPMKLMEDNKRPIVHWLNEKMGVDQTAPDGHKLTPDEIYIEQEQPKQSWLNVLLRRTLATAAVVGTGQALNELARDRTKTAAFAKSHPNSKEDPHGGKSRVEKWVVDTVNSGLNKVGATGLTKDKNGMFQRYLALAALDTVFTKITAVIMKVTNGAKKARMPGEVGDDDSRAANPNSVDTIQYNPENEEARKKAAQPTEQPEPAQAPRATETTPESKHASRIIAERGVVGSPAAEAVKKALIKKAENFTSRSEKSDSTPSVSV